MHTLEFLVLKGPDEGLTKLAVSDSATVPALGTHIYHADRKFSVESNDQIRVINEQRVRNIIILRAV